MSRATLCVQLALAVAAATTASAQKLPPLGIRRLSAPVTIDGNPNDAAWRDIEPLPMTLYTPIFRGTPTQRTEIRVAYDNEYFYAAGWFYDQDASSIRVNSLYRDRWNGDDAFAIYIDAFNDKRNSKWFGTTPGGIRFDQLVSDDGATLNGSWDTSWSAATTLTKDGWFAEIRIPFSSLGFRTDAEGKAVMGLTVTRLVSRMEERVTFPEIDPRSEFRRPSVAREVVLRNVRPRTPLYVTPYALTGRAQNAVSIAGTPAAFHNIGKTSREVGLDVRYPLSGNLTLDLTANTDFAQVEADDQQVNLDRFPLFYPERRRFFQENSGLFDFTTSFAGLRLFNSRRIGLTPALTPIPVTGGARLVGRMGAWDVGMLQMQTRADDGFPTENFGVLRMRRPVFDPLSTAGFLATSFFDGNGRRNVAGGADGSFHVHGDHYLVLKAAGVTDRGDTTGASLSDRSLIDAKWERRTGRGLQYNVNFTRAGKDYAPELGFTPRRDFTSANVYGNWFLFTDSSRFFRRVYPGALAFQTFRNSDHALESAQWAVWVEWDAKNGGGGWVEPKAFHENVLIPFTIGGTAQVPA